MTWSFGDGFDLYATAADVVNGYWDSSPNNVQLGLTAGRFSGSQAITVTFANVVVLVKSSGVNDPVHHLVVGFRQTAAITGSSLYGYFQLLDGTTAQCTVLFRSDGAILLQSGAVGGTTLATYTGAFPVANTWYAFEIEVVINSATGAFRVRKNGNNVNDFDSGAVLNTRGGTANNYANKLQIGESVNSAIGQAFDDFFWQSGAAAGNWLGDIRCITRMPVSDQSVTFSKSPTNFLGQASTTVTGNTALAANLIRAVAVAAPSTGTLASLVFNFSAAVTGHVKMALYDASGSGGGPGALLASSVELTNPGAGLTTFNIVGGPTVQRGVTYWLALWADASVSGVTSFSTDTLALTYTTSFPSTMVGFTGPSVVAGMGSNGMNVTPFNAGCVNEPQQDGLTSYVYDSNPGDQDFYGVGSITSTPATVIATTVRAYAQKSDAGTRTMTVQLKSGAATVASPTMVLTTSGFQWAWRTDLTDPNTGSAWTPAAVNNVQIGPKVIA